MNKQEWLKERKEKGLCYNCSNEAVHNKTRCANCQIKDSQIAKNKANKRKLQGICIKCSSVTVNAYCDKCNIKCKKDRIHRLSCGICAYCKKNQKVNGKTHCQSCINRKKAKHNDKKASGICCGSGCHNPPQYNKTRCNECVAKLKSRYAQLRLEVLTHYGLKCNCMCECTISNIKHLTIDHINNDGASHRKTVGSGESFYKWIIKNDFPDFLQVLCWNCNCAKQYFGGCL